ncbi:hypothetical protein P280DRAFT_666 [Massarina eburnea CBS 473.64]|uniref:Uncharacterized protein n=1 Tax=Massarina eburnea CBS 473.64 TaxID=1395130 RepID=A0A6A6SH70_9PLEO|nr:hypothetical protein P280DRAFT_666 [Massarina eburnea CBS 473.64]
MMSALPSSIHSPSSSRAAQFALAHPTPTECRKIWTNISTTWSDALPFPEHMEESHIMTPVPLARNGGMTVWILTDSSLSLSLAYYTPDPLFLRNLPKTGIEHQRWRG